jgi:hypothetical protein
MQWWYFDALLNDGGVLVVAFVPRKWWREAAGAKLDDGFLFVSVLRPDGKTRVFTRSFESSGLRCFKAGVEAGGKFAIGFDPSGSRPRYKLSFSMEGLQGSLEATCLEKPFSPLPFGTRPGGPGFAYVAQVPRGAVFGALTLHSEPIPVDGVLYHEQGRFDDLPERLSEGWQWFHFLHPDWNLFGVPGLFAFIQNEDRKLFSGVRFSGNSYGMNAPLLEKGELHFKKGDLRLRLSADADRWADLISFPSADSRQLWSTGVTTARLIGTACGKAVDCPGQVILETCRLSLR